MKKSLNCLSECMSRREFIGKTALASGALTLSPFGITKVTGNKNMMTESALNNVKIGVKFVHNDIVHEDVWEGSCRHGKPEELTYESEMKRLKNGFENLQKNLQETSFVPEAEILKPVFTMQWVEKGNPMIMLKEEQLHRLKEEDDKTDMYVVCGGGLAQYTCLQIARRYNKPVVYMNENGWAIDAPAGLRHEGYEGYHVQNIKQLNDLIQLFVARKAVQNTKILILTNFPDTVPQGVVSSIIDMDVLKSKYGINSLFIDYKDFFNEMDKVAKDKEKQELAGKLADDLMRNAYESSMKREEIINSVNFYLTANVVMNKYDCNAFTVECFELCSSLEPWDRRFTPCGTHALLKDTGIPSACEKDINALMAMMILMYLSKKASYMGNPDVDMKNNILRIHHSVASKKMKGIESPETPYRITNWTNSGFGLSFRYDFNRDKNEVVTVGRFDPSAAKMLLTRGTITGGGGLEGRGCTQYVTIKIPRAKEFFHEQQNFGHHLSIVYGDYTEQVQYLSKMMGFGVVSII